MGRHRKETQRVEEKRERERANAAGAATRRVRRFQERLALTRKSKIVKSNFVETFAILSLSLSLSLFSLRLELSRSHHRPLWRFRCRRFTHYGNVPSERRRPKFPRILFAIDRFSGQLSATSIRLCFIPRNASPLFFQFLFRITAVHDAISLNSHAT